MFNIWGDTNHKFVRDANVQVSRCALLIHLAMALGIVWILEQPLSSLLIFHPRMQDLAKDFAMYKISFAMERYGSKTKKPTKLYSNADWIGDFADSEWYVDPNPDFDSPVTYTKYFDANGQPKVQGGKDLKNTQDYTRRFAQEVRSLWRTNCRGQCAPRPEVVQDPEHLKQLLHMEPGGLGPLKGPPKGIYCNLRGNSPKPQKLIFRLICQLRGYGMGQNTHKICGNHLPTR